LHNINIKYHYIKIVAMHIIDLGDLSNVINSQDYKDIRDEII